MTVRERPTTRRRRRRAARRAGGSGAGEGLEGLADQGERAELGVGGLPLLRRLVGCGRAGRAERGPVEAGLVDGEADVSAAEGGDTAFRGEGGVVGAGLAGGRPFHGVGEQPLGVGPDGAEEFAPSVEVPVGGGGRDADPAGRLAQDDPFGAALGGEVDGGADQRVAQVAVVVGLSPEIAAMDSSCPMFTA